VHLAAGLYRMAVQSARHVEVSMYEDHILEIDEQADDPAPLVVNHDKFMDSVVEYHLIDKAVALLKAGKMMDFIPEIHIDGLTRVNQCTMENREILESWKAHFRNLNEPFLITADKAYRTLWKRRIV